MPRLRISRLDEPVREVALVGEVSIGRHPDNVVVLPDPAVSGAHARIVVGDRSRWIEDLMSANGTLIEGRRAPPGQPVPLAGGERMMIGPFVLSYVDDARLDRSAPLDGLLDEGHAAPRNARSGEAKAIRVLAVIAAVAVIAALAVVVGKRIV